MISIAAPLNTVAAVSPSLVSNPATDLWRVVSRAGCLTKSPTGHQIVRARPFGHDTFLTLIYYPSVSVGGLNGPMGGRDRGHQSSVGRCLRLAADAASRGACRLFAAGQVAVFDRGDALVAWPLGGRDLGGRRHIRFGNLVLHSPQAFSRCCRRGAREGVHPLRRRNDASRPLSAVARVKLAWGRDPLRRGNAQRHGPDMRFGVFCDDQRNRWTASRQSVPAIR